MGYFPSMNLEQFTAELLALPVSQRARLAKVLADSIDDFIDGRIEESWDEAVEKRVAEYEKGETQLVDSSAVHEEARRRLEETR
jgi:putative addiction module component (TIGR02574 family)